MCLNLIDSYPPPTVELQRCRYILQGIAAANVGLILLGIICSVYDNIIINILLVFLTFLAWSQFNYTLVLMLTFYNFFNLIISVITIIGIIQFYLHGELMDNVKGSYIIYTFFSINFYSMATFMNYFCYRHLKSYYLTGGFYTQVRNNGFFGGNSSRQQASYNNGTQMRQINNRNNRQHFQGQGVMIG